MKHAVLFALVVALCYAQTSELVPAATTLAARYRATGTLQINCTGVGTVSGPLNIQSTLADLSTGAAAGNYTSTGFAANDGSSTRVVTNFNSTSNAPNLTNFVATALRVAGDRTLDRIVFITRYDTQGGTFPADSCTADNVGTLNTVDFSASYGFYRSAVPTVANGILKNTYRAVGTLELVCTNGTYAAPSNIESILTTVDGSNTQVGIYNGSFVNTVDGSVTRATGNVVPAINNAPNAALTNFVQSAATTPGSRALDNIAFITRYDTVGGAATAADPACTSANEASVLNKNFEATYGFYVNSAVTTTTSTATTSTTTTSTFNSPTTSTTTTTAAGNSATAIGMSALFVSGLVLATL